MSLPKISSAMLVVTHRCNLRCRYCFVSKQPADMSLDTAKAAADLLLKNAEDSGAVPSINFFGGEPTLMWDSVIVPLTEYIRARNVPFSLSMTSNGILLDAEKLRYMRERSMGLLFSIDGAKATQDFNRPFPGGKGSFDALSGNIRAIAESFPNVTFRMTAIPETCGNLFANIMFAEGSGFRSFFVMPDNFQPWPEEARQELRAQLTRYADYFIDCYRAGRTPIGFSSFNDAIGDIRRINSAEERRASPRCHAEGKCGLGSGRFASIHPDGSVYGCQELTSNEGPESPFWIGNIFTGVLDSRRYALMGRYCAESVRGGECESCLYDGICDGGCVANNYLCCGDLNSVPEVQCRWKRALLDEAVRVTRVLGGERNESFREFFVRL